jgi:hypothetical protein
MAHVLHVEGQRLPRGSDCGAARPIPDALWVMLSNRCPERRNAYQVFLTQTPAFRPNIHILNVFVPYMPQ